MTISSKLTRSLAAAALTVPLTMASMAAPASAATNATNAALADFRSPYPPALGGGYGYPYGYGGQQTSSYTGLDTTDATTSQSVGLVEITTTIDYDEGEAAGTGIVIGSDGLVVTNHHVVEGATDIAVTVVSTGDQYQAEVLGYDATKDVAVLQLEDASGLTTATTDSGTLAEGASVTAVGDAGGDGGTLTAAAGTITDLHHPITVEDDTTGEEVDLHNLVEVTSDVVPGDSGGALLDSDGDVVGMNVAASTGADVTGYVIPIRRVLGVVDDVLAGDDNGSAVIGGTPFLGVALGDTTTTLAGVLDGGPAAGLGLAAGDTITSIGGAAVSTADELRAAVADHAPGATVTLSWTDGNGESHTGSLTLATAPVG
jgi:S1-C subfamily serine protease